MREEIATGLTEIVSETQLQRRLNYLERKLMLETKESHIFDNDIYGFNDLHYIKSLTITQDMSIKI